MTSTPEATLFCIPSSDHTTVRIGEVMREGNSTSTIEALTNASYLSESLFEQDWHHVCQERLVIVLVVHGRSEEHTSELQSLMRISYAVFCLKKKRTHKRIKDKI